MNTNTSKTIAILMFAPLTVCLSFGIANAQIQSSGGGYYVAGYGTVYGSFGQASAAQSRMYDAVKSQNRRTAERNALIQKWGLAEVEKAEREKVSGSARSASPKIVVPPPRVVRDHGVFRPDPTVDTGRALADALGETPEEKALIRQIYTTTKSVYETEAAKRGWKNNIAAGLTFFTVAAMSAYHDTEMPGEQAISAYYKVVNAALDDIPELGSAANKDKQGFNDMLVGFGGMMLAIYAEAKETGDPKSLANSKKLAGMLIPMVLKTDPEKLRTENGQIVMK